MTLSPRSHPLNLRTAQVWFNPVWSGDFRLLRVDDDNCDLSVENPTGAELVVLGNLATAAKANGWVDGDVVFAPVGETRVRLRASIAAAGPLVSGSVHGDARFWTAVRHENGQVVVVSGVPSYTPEAHAEAEVEAALDAADLVDGATTPTDSNDPRLVVSCTTCGAPPGRGCTTLGANPRLRAPHVARKALVTVGAGPPAVVAAGAVAPAAVAAATVREPYRGCPAPTACRRRASEVLRTFSTEDQWKTWEAEGRMTLLGARTGRRYDLFHRDEAASRRLTHVLVERRTGDALCVWDDTVPPEEEALGIKLAVEHREGWLRRLPRGVVKLGSRALDGRHRENWGAGRRVIAAVGASPYGE